MKKEKNAKQSANKEKIIKAVKSLIGPVILCAIILIGVFVVINYKGTEETTEAIRINAYDGSETPVVMENDNLKFVLDPTTTQFSIEVKDTGKIWYSNPVDAANDTIALASEKGRIQSTLTMTYSNQAGLETVYNNYDYSISKGIYEIEAGDDFVKVNYSLGNTEKEFMIPPVARASEFEALLGKMKNDYASMVKQYYKKYDINKLGKKDNKDELLANYPVLAEEPIYVLRDNAKDGLKVKFQLYFEEAGYTPEMYAADKELNLAEKSSDKPIFNVNMIYRLDGNDLVVEVPMNEMEFQEKYPIYNVTLLPFFGAGGTEDEGYIVVPEGGGALINFNNGKTAQNSYYANMYGWDMALSRDAVVHNTRAFYNTFGIANGDSSFICILEDGASYASVQADISGRFNSYNTANVVYSVMQREKYDVGEIANSDVYVYTPNVPDEKIIQRYRFVDSNDYVDMAKEYQGYLKDKYGAYLTENDDTQAPVVIEVVGAVDKVKQVLGVPVSRPLKLTTYEEASEIVQELYNEGLQNMSVKMTGWCNGGENQKMLNKAKTISALGSKSDLKKMIQNSANLGVDVYLDGVTQYAYNSDIFDGFFSFSDAARFISKERAELFVYSDVTYSAREGFKSFYLLHTDEAEKMTDNLNKTARKYNTGVSFRETGKDLSADYYVKNTVTREAAKSSQSSQLQAMADSDMNVMINMGNDYAMPYADLITNMDLKGSEYTILDTYIPFYQLAIHGFVNYTGEALNLSGEMQEELLHSVEYGAGLSFSVMRETAFALQKTLYTEYFGSAYDSCHQTIVDTYNRYNAELGHTFNQQMVDHKQVTPEMSCTTYEDGTKVFVNYSYADVTADGVTVPARDYKVVR